MKNVPFVAIICMMLILCASCTTQKFPERRTKGEKITLRVIEDPAYLNMENLLAQNPRQDLVSRGAPLLAPFVGQTFSFAYNQVKRLFKTDVTKYKSTYGAGQNQHCFYQTISQEGMTDPAGIQFKGLQLSRTVTDKQEKTDTALYASFSIDRDDPYELLNNSTFRLRLDSLNLRYTRARVKTHSFLRPSGWFYFRKPALSLDFTINVYSSWMTEQTQVYNRVLLGTFKLHLQDIPENPSSEAFQTYYTNLKDSLLSGSCFLIPRSVASIKSDEKSFVKCYSKGLYDIAITVEETGLPGKAQNSAVNYEMLLNPMEPYLLQQLMKQLKLR
jgi:hypothetical protein